MHIKASIKYLNTISVVISLSHHIQCVKSVVSFESHWLKFIPIVTSLPVKKSQNKLLKLYLQANPIPRPTVHLCAQNVPNTHILPQSMTNSL